MEPEDEYDAVNEDLAAFLRGGPAPWQPGRNYFDAQRERRRLFDERVDVDFLEDMAGALGLDGVEALYDRDDVEIELRRRQQRGQTRALPPPPPPPPTPEPDPREELAAIETQLQVVQRRQRDPRIAQMQEVGQRVAHRFVSLQVARVDVEIMLQATGLPTQALCHRLGQVLQWMRGARPNTGAEADAEAFTPVILFMRYLDMHERDQHSLCHLLTEANATATELATVGQLRGEFSMPSVPVAPEEAGPACSPLPVEDGVDWARLVGQPVVLLPALQTHYVDTAWRAMAETGCRQLYGAHRLASGGDYVAIVMRYLFATTQQEKAQTAEDLRLRLNIFEAEASGQPPGVAALLKLVQPEKYDEAINKQVLLAHFLWCYFTKASLQRLADDWKQYGLELTRDTLQTDALQTAIQLCKRPLADYFCLLLTVMAREWAGPVIRLTPQVMRFLLDIQGSANTFEQLAELFRTRASLTDLFPPEDTASRQLMASGGDGNGGLVRLIYPVVDLLTLVAIFQAQSERQLQALLVRQRALQHQPPPAEVPLPRFVPTEEEGEEDAVGMRLKPVYQYALRHALAKVKAACNDLRTLTAEALQSAQAKHTGLRLAFLDYMAAVMREEKMRGAPNTKSQRRDVMRGTWQLMRTLKGYRVKRVGRHRYAITSTAAPSALDRVTLF